MVSMVTGFTLHRQQAKITSNIKKSKATRDSYDWGEVLKSLKLGVL